MNDATLQEPKTTEVFDIGINNSTLTLVQVEGERKIAIANEEKLNEMGKSLGLQNGDVLIKINGEDFPNIGPELNGFVQKHWVDEWVKWLAAQVNSKQGK